MSTRGHPGKGSDSLTRTQAGEGVATDKGDSLCIDQTCNCIKDNGSQDLPGGPAAIAPYSQCRGPRFNPWSGNYVSQTTTKSPHTATKIQRIQRKKENNGRLTVK